MDAGAGHAFAPGDAVKPLALRNETDFVPLFILRNLDSVEHMEINLLNIQGTAPGEVDGGRAAVVVDHAGHDLEADLAWCLIDPGVVVQFTAGDGGSFAEATAAGGTEAIAVSGVGLLNVGVVGAEVGALGPLRSGEGDPKFGTCVFCAGSCTCFC